MENAEKKGRKTSMGALSSAALGALLCLFAGMAHADTYTLPDGATSEPFNCTLISGTSYACGNISLDKDAVINFTGPVTLNVAGNFNASKSFDTSGNAYPFQINATGNISFQKDVVLKGGVSAQGNISFDKSPNVTGNISAGGNVSIDKDANITGNIAAGGNVSINKDADITGNIAAGGNISIDKGSTITGDVDAGGNLSVDKDSTITGHCTYSSTNYYCIPPSANFHHLELRHATGSGITCATSVLTLKACADNTCSSTYTGGLNGALTGLASPTNFAIASGAATTTVTFQPKAGTITFGASGITPSPASGTTCNFGNPSCNFTGTNAGFIFSSSATDPSATIPTQTAGVQTANYLRAVQASSTNAAVCTPAIINKTVPVTMSYTCDNPGTCQSGDLLKLNSTLLAAANGPASIDFNFDADGSAPVSIRYQDVGKITINASKTFMPTGGTTLVTLNGSTGFVVKPDHFGLSEIKCGSTDNPAATTVDGDVFCRAGANFYMKATALTATGATAKNYGKESPVESIKLTAGLPAGLGLTSNPGLNGTLGAVVTDTGAASGAAFSWNEVGIIILIPSVGDGDYLDVGDVAGTAVNVGRFIPDHFDTSVTQPSTFTYSGQPFTSVTVTARSVGGTTTTNFHKDSFAKAVTLTAPASPAVAPALEPGALSAIAPSALPLPAADFLNEAATRGSLTATGTLLYTFTNKQTAPTVVKLHAVDTDGVISGVTEGSATIRSGRLRLSNAFGRANANLSIPMRAEYWSGQSWLINSLDNDTLIPAGAVALTLNGVTGVTVDPITKLVGGQGAIVLKKADASTGSVDLAVNLGSGIRDQSCLAAHPDTPPGSAQPWLRSLNGACLTGYNSDPSARGTFGIFAPETRKVIHIRESFN